MKLKEIHRTATFAWSPFGDIPLLATGTVAGALDESFSNDSQLEIWAPDFRDKSEYDLGGIEQKGPAGAISTTSRFNRIVWGTPTNSRSKGVIAAGMESGELGLWDPEKIVATSNTTESLILRNTTHQGSVRGLDFNPIQTNLLSSGATNGEIYIWDLKDPSKPYSPGTRSSKLDEITSLAWNKQVQYVLASASSTGNTVVWDLRNKREVVSLAYGGASQGLNIMGAGGRKGVSDITWQPDNATRLVTASEDDASPIVMVWDLRNARAPEKILTGHERGVLSLSWCRQDPDLLLSCGKDNRALCWNPQSGDIIGELPYAENWAFQVQWCPRNPDLLATAYFDGTIGIHTLQNTNESVNTQASAPTPKADGSDVFDVPGFSRTTQPTLSLKQPPKWLRRPVSASFGYGGRLVSVSNLPSAQGKTQSSSVHLRKVTTEPSVVARAELLLNAASTDELNSFAQKKSEEVAQKTGRDLATWKALASLFRADSREELITLLGFSKSEIEARVAEAVEKIKAASAPTPTQVVTDELALDDSRPTPPVVTFVEPEADDDVEDDAEKTPSERSASIMSDHTDATKPIDAESTTTAPSLFADDIGTPQMDGEADFFSTIGTIRSTVPEHVRVPHQNYAHDSSVAATIGSRPSSAAPSEVLKNTTFRIYPSEESDIDKLITKALVLGDFEAAVTLCLSSERYADAILLAVKGGPELLQRTQQKYFEKSTTSHPYLRLFQSIVTEDLDDIVQNADLQEWQEIFVVICTFAKQEEFANLAEQLGQRLEFQATVAKNADTAGVEELRKNATLAYLAAGRLEKVVNIWIDEMQEEESFFLGSGDAKSGSRYSAHAHSLQTFMEKVLIFRSATKYKDADLNVTPDPSTERTYKLANLYERYFEYADLLATQGLLKQAVGFLKYIPSDYHNTELDFPMARERLQAAAGERSPRAPVAGPSTAATITTSASKQAPAYGTGGYAPYTAPTTSTRAAPSAYNPYSAVPVAATTSNPYAPAATSMSAQQQQYGPTPTMQQQYTSTAPMQNAAMNAYAPMQSVPVPAPPPPISSTPPTAAPPPPPKKRENGGWNDAPPVADRRTPNVPPSKVNAITAPFPNASPSLPGSPAMHGSSHILPPPPRPGSVNRNQSMPPPPPPGQYRGGPPPGPPSQIRPNPYGARGHALPPEENQGVPPPSVGGHSQYAPPPSINRTMTSPQPQLRQGPPPQGQFGGRVGPPPGPGGPGPYAPATPPPGWAGPPGSGPGMPQQLNSGGPPPGQPTGGAYAPPPQVGRPMPPPGGPGQGPPPPPMAMGGPPPVVSPGGLQGPPPVSGGAPPARPPPSQQGPPPPKYPPGDREHIPESSQRAYEVLRDNLEHMKQTTPLQQKRMVDDIERRLNNLFDALNCETLSPPVVAYLNDLTSAMAQRDQQQSLQIHAELLSQGSRTDDIGIWMSAIKFLIMRL